MTSLSADLSRNGWMDPYKDSQPKVTDFDKFLPWACNEFSIFDDIIVTRATQTAYPAASTKKGQTAKSKIKVDDIDSDDNIPSSENENPEIDLESAIKIKTFYDNNENLVQIKFLGNKAIPRKIMQVIGMAIPYHKQLTSIAINRGLSMETLYEMAKFLPDSNLTELCLDNTFLTKANYHTLLTHGKLKHLSLARCSINDAIVKTITDQLGAPSPASRVLSALNLSSNRITDVGAKHVAGMLRTNRQLSYLNIAGNMITDEGGMSILDTLQKFPLGSEEILETRARYKDYLKTKNEYIQKIMIELQTPKEIAKKKSTWKGKQDNYAETKMEPFKDPFSPDNTESQDGVASCFGNNTLCYLNVAYNNLTYASVKKLLKVLLTQKSLNRTPKGLIKVVIEGNLMPVACKEYEEISRLFNESVLASNVKTKSRKKSITRI